MLLSLATVKVFLFFYGVQLGLLSHLLPQFLSDAQWSKAAFYHAVQRLSKNSIYLGFSELFGMLLPHLFSNESPR